MPNPRGTQPTITAQGLLLDLDGVLVDSTAAVERHWRIFAGWYGLDPARLLRAVHGRRSTDVICELASRLRQPTERVVGRFEQLDVADQDGVAALPGAAELVALLPAGRWAIVTSGSRPVALARLAAAGLAPPARLITGEQVTAGKPDPAPYRLGAERLGLAAGDCVVVEDAPAGLVSARAAGCRTLALLTTHARGELTGVHWVARDLSRVRISDPGPPLRLTVEEAD